MAVSWSWIRVVADPSAFHPGGWVYEVDAPLPAGYSVQRVLAMGGMAGKRTVTGTSPFNGGPAQFSWQSTVSLQLLGETATIVYQNGGIVPCYHWQDTGSGGPSTWVAQWGTPAGALDVDFRLRARSTGDGSKVVFTQAVSLDNGADPQVYWPLDAWLGNFFAALLYSFNPAVAGASADGPVVQPTMSSLRSR